MKIRWNGSGVRLRISPSELETLRRGEMVREMLLLGEKGWHAELQCATQTGLSFEAATLRLELSPPDCAHFCEPTVEGVYFSTPTGTRFYVEKDFPCVHPRTSPVTEESETFEAPPGFFERKNVED